MAMGIVLFTVAIMFFVFNFVGNTIVDSVTPIAAINESTQSLSAFQSIGDVVNKLDYVVFGLFVGLLLALIITSWFISGNPIFMFIYFIVVIISTIISTMLANTWEDITTTAVFGTTINSFPLTNNLMLNLPIYITIAGFIGMIIMFGKPFFQDE
jgi:hypothetical protein